MVGDESETRSGTVTFLDVGQGLSVLLEYDGHFALYDAGPDSANFVDTLKNRGIDSLDWVLLSHNHRDHLGGLLELFPAVSIGRLMVGPDSMGGFLVDSLLRVARRFGVPVDTVLRGGQACLGCGSVQEASAGGLRLDFLWPPAYARVGENGASVVARVSLVGTADCADDLGVAGTVLLTGDLDSLGESRLLEISSDVSAGILQVGHHGSAHSSTLRFLNRVSPRYAVISVGRQNGYGHPTESVLRKLQYVLGVASDTDSVTLANSPQSIFRTDVHGSVSFQLVPCVGIVR